MSIYRFVGRLSPPWMAVLAFVLLIPSVTNQSLGLFESQTWDYARLGGFGDFVDEMRTDTGPESKMPLAMFAAWGWARAWGTSEYAMRALNFVWLAVLLGALASVGRKISVNWLPLLAAIQPFLWYSMDQARPEVMEMAGGALLMAGVISTVKGGCFTPRGLTAYCAGALLLTGANIFGLVPIFVIFLGVTLHGFWKNLPGGRWAKLLAASTGCLLLAMVVYYVATLIDSGTGPQLWTVTPLNLAYAAYEFLGFTGLGPGRQTLRAILKGFEPAAPHWASIPAYAALAAAYAGVLASAGKSWLTKEFTRPRPSQTNGWIWWLSVGTILEAALLLFLIALATGLPFWGKHLSGVFPFWLTALGLVLTWSRQGLWRKSGRRWGALLVVLLVASTALIRLAPHHGHDDYRSAAAEAKKRADAGQTVWWVADNSGGAYYGLVYDSPTPTGGIILFAHNISPGRPSPDAIILSRPENFDTQMASQQLLKTDQFKIEARITAIEIWGKAGSLKKQ